MWLCTDPGRASRCGCAPILRIVISYSTRTLNNPNQGPRQVVRVLRDPKCGAHTVSFPQSDRQGSPLMCEKPTELSSVLTSHGALLSLCMGWCLATVPHGNTGLGKPAPLQIPLSGIRGSCVPSHTVLNLCLAFILCCHL